MKSLLVISLKRVSFHSFQFTDTVIVLLEVYVKFTIVSDSQPQLNQVLNCIVFIFLSSLFPYSISFFFKLLLLCLNSAPPLLHLEKKERFFKLLCTLLLTSCISIYFHLVFYFIDSSQIIKAIYEMVATTY